MGSDAIALNFSKELDSTDCSMQICLEILDFKSDVIYFNKNWYLCIMSNLNVRVRPTHPFASIWCNLREDLIYEWPEINRPIFWLINTFSCTGWSVSLFVFNVLSRLHGHKHKSAFCWMKYHWTWLLSDNVAWDSF